MHPVAQGVALGIMVASIIHSLVITITRRRNYRPALLVYGSLLLLTLWLGSYIISPLGFSSGRIPRLRGFLVTRSHGVPLTIASGQTVSLGYGSIMEIQPDTLPGPVDCMWSSATGGAFDDPTSCDTAFSPARGVQYDVLRVRVQSACWLPTSLGEVKIAILP